MGPASSVDPRLPCQWLVAVVQTEEPVATLGTVATVGKACAGGGRDSSGPATMPSAERLSVMPGCVLCDTLSPLLPCL